LEDSPKFPWGTGTARVITPLFIKHSYQGKLTLLYVYDMVSACDDHDTEKAVFKEEASNSI